MTIERDAHPDEGTIHAWLDRQLDDATTATLEAHLQRCDECAERVAEARGLMAGASRVVASLDDADAVTSDQGIARPWGPAILPTTRPRGLRTFRFTPARSAIAAVLVVAVATAIVHENQQPSSRLASVAAESAAAVASGVPPMATAPSVSAPAAAPLASAPSGAPANSPVTRGLDSTAAARVATARAYSRAQRETTVNADLARVGQVPAPQASTPLAQAVDASRAADNAVVLRGAAPGVVAGQKGVAGGIARGVITAAPVAAIEAPLCYRVESANGLATSWGPVPLPLTLALDAPATRASARVLGADGRDTDVRARLDRLGNDSLLFTLQRIGYSGTLTVGAPGEIRAGVMRSAPAVMALGQVVVTAESGATERRRALRAPSTAQVRAESAATAPQREATPAVPVVVRKVECGSRE